MKRLLCIVSSMDRGGAETFLMKTYRQLDKNKYQMDFCVSKRETGFYDDEIKKMGGKIYYVPPKTKRIIKNFFNIKKIVKEKQYKYVLRTSQQSLAALDLLAAKCGGARILIYRSSNAGVTNAKIINNIFKPLPKIIPNVKLAPSIKAAEFVFGKRAVLNNDVIILHNALNYDDFEFKSEIRDKIRNELKIKNEVLYGHIGRLNKQKNHTFLLDVFSEILKKQENSKLLLIGDGELRQNIIDRINELRIEKNVIFLEAQKNVNEYFMAMDKMIFPSLFEGMPNVIIEAQASGLPCYISNTITEEANITGLVKYIDLNKSSKEWANIILSDEINKRKDFKDKFIEKKYMIQQIVDEFVKNCYKESE